MRKALIIALCLAGFGTLASMRPVFALASGQSTAAACRIQNIQCNKKGSKVCGNTYLNCLSPTLQLGGGAAGPGPAPDSSQRKNIRPN
jgi:hypothetical protein